MHFTGFGLKTMGGGGGAAFGLLTVAFQYELCSCIVFMVYFIVTTSAINISSFQRGVPSGDATSMILSLCLHPTGRFLNIVRGPSMET